MQPGIEPMPLDGGSDELAYALLQRKPGHFSERATGDLHELPVMPLDDGADQRVFAGEILVERAHADACLLRDPVRARRIETLLDQNASSRFDQRIHGGTGPLLRGVFSGLCERSARHLFRSRNASIQIRAIARILHLETEIATET